MRNFRNHYLMLLFFLEQGFHKDSEECDTEDEIERYMYKCTLCVMYA